MDKKIIEQLKRQLEKEKESLEKNLQGFARKKEKSLDDWKTQYPKFDKNSNLEEAADEVEEYENLLPVEHNLELRLKDVNTALEKIKKNAYGKCEKCGKPISIQRLKAYPEAKTCNKCD